MTTSPRNGDSVNAAFNMPVAKMVTDVDFCRYKLVQLLCI